VCGNEFETTKIRFLCCSKKCSEQYKKITKKRCNEEYRKKNKDKMKEYMKEYYKENKDKWPKKEYNSEYFKEYYEKNKEKVSKRNKVCYNKKRNERLEKAKEYYENNEDKIKEYQREYRKTKKGKEIERNKRNKRRSIYNFSDITTDFLINLKEETEYCPLCGCRLSNKRGDNKYHLDHIIPINVGGRHIMDNVRFICRKCNLTRPKDGSDILEVKNEIK
jgi:hypothetical protein